MDADPSLMLSHSSVYFHEVGGGNVRRLLMSEKKKKLPQFASETRPEASRRQLKSEGQSEFTEAKQRGGRAGRRWRERKCKLKRRANFLRLRVGRSQDRLCVSAVTSSPAGSLRTHGLAPGLFG